MNAEDTDDLQNLDAGVSNQAELLKFLVLRQFAYVETDEEESDDGQDAADARLSGPLSGLSLDETTCVGFNGRCNKVADTCYCWWVGGTLDVSRTYSVHVPG